LRSRRAGRALIRRPVSVDADIDGVETEEEGEVTPVLPDFQGIDGGFQTGRKLRANLLFVRLLHDELQVPEVDPRLVAEANAVNDDERLPG
jgi:hypothetical protein